MVWDNLKIICETSCAIALAVILKNKEFFKEKNVCIFLTGGNIDMTDTKKLLDL